MAETPVLSVQGLVAGYGSKAIVRDISFDLHQGEALVIVGQNGSGKSTLLRTIAGLLPPLGGQMLLHGQPLHLLPHQLVSHGISYFPQGGLVMPGLTVQEHLLLAGRLSNPKNTKNLPESEFGRIFAVFPQLRAKLNQQAGNLSGGERQMLSFAILLMHNTRIWLLDEPTAGLSPEMVNDTISFLFSDHRRFTTFVVVEHNEAILYSGLFNQQLCFI